MSIVGRTIGGLWERLRKIGPCQYSEDEFINADIENDMRDHTKALEAARAAIANQETANQELHDVLETSRERSREFAEFEELIRKETRRVRRIP